MKFRKQILTTSLFLLIVGFSYAQTKEQELSNAEKFSAKSGTLLQKEFIEIGKISTAKIKVIHFSDLINNVSQSALKFENESTSKYSSDIKVAVLDADEIEALMKSIKLIQERIFPTTPTLYTEISFKSRGGFEAGCYWSDGSWSTYLKLEKYDKDSYVFLNKEDFPTLLVLLEKAKAKL